MAENGYAKPVLVTSDWVAEQGGDENVVVAEVDENPDLYEEGHLRGAVKLHWQEDLQDPIERDLVDRPTFEQLLARPDRDEVVSAVERRLSKLPPAALQIWRTLATAASTSAFIASTLLRTAGSWTDNLSDNQAVSIFNAASVLPNSSWISRAITAFSSSRTACRCADKACSCSRDSRSASSASRFSSRSRCSSTTRLIRAGSSSRYCRSTSLTR